MLLHSARHSFLPALALLATLGGCAQESETEAELLTRAKAIHDRVITLDTHKDISSDLASEEAPSDPSERERFLQRNDPTLEGPNQVDFPKMRAGGLDVAFTQGNRLLYPHYWSKPTNGEALATYHGT